MQDEITKHSKKIYKTAKNSEHTLGEKVKEIIIEIFIIVFAVTLSIWLHSWSEHRHQQEEVSVFLGNLKNDLENDIKNIDTEKKAYQESNIKYEKILALTTPQLDSIYKSKNKVDFPVYSHGPKMNIANYEGFKSSGKIGYIEDEKLKQKILNYYQIFVPAINEVDKYYNDFLFKCFDKMIENADQPEEKLYSDPKFKKTIEFLVRLGKNNIRVYDQNTKPLSIELIKEIEKEMNK
jgi:dsDNA-binding SOS-regulon protein